MTTGEKEMKEALDREFDEALEDFKTEEERKKREEITRKIIIQQKELLHKSNPLEDIITTLDDIDGFCQYRNKIIALDENYIIKGMTRSAKRILDYRQKHEPPPFLGKSYTELLYPDQLQTFKRNVENKIADEESMQRIIVPGRKKSKIHIKSTILSYRATRKGSLYGIIIGWSGNKLFG